MQIVFPCRHCFAECFANPSKDKGLVVCGACRKQQVLHYTDAHRAQNSVDSCAVCRRQDFYIRDEARKAWGLVYLFAGVVAAHPTYGASLLPGVFGFYWYFRKYPKLTVCYHCYAKYRNARVNPEHQEYDLEKMERFEKAIRDDRTFRDFP
jgi:hypothetical protein